MLFRTGGQQKFNANDQACHAVLRHVVYEDRHQPGMQLLVILPMIVMLGLCENAAAREAMGSEKPIAAAISRMQQALVHAARWDQQC